jgi:hypothetical protein
LVLFIYRIDENVVGVVEEGNFIESEDQNQDHFAEQGKLPPELAPHIYMHLLL